MTKTLEAAKAVNTNGYLPVPIGKGLKYPPMENWPKFRLTAFTEKLFPADAGVGIICGQVVGVDIDVMDEPFSVAFGQEVQSLFGKAPVRVGMAPKRLLVYRTEVPFSKKVVNLAHPDGRTAKLEILAEGQQFVAFHIHPDTNKPYRWISGGDPRTVPVMKLPVLCEAGANLIIDAFITLGDTMGYSLASKKSGAARTADDEVWDILKGKPDFTDEQVDDVLGRLPGADQYETWLECGMALHNHYNGGVDGLMRWDAWSAKSGRYDGFDTLERKWQGFGGGSMTFATMVYRAGGLGSKKAGVEAGPAPEPDVDLVATIDTWPDLATLKDGVVTLLCQAKQKGLAELALDSLLDRMNARIVALGGKALSRTTLKELGYKIKKDAKAAAPPEEQPAYQTDTIEGLAILLEDTGYRLRYNEMAKLIEITNPSVATNSDNHINGMLANIVSSCEAAGASPRHVADYVPYICDLNTYHPVKDWIEGAPWDGVERLGLLLDTLVVAPEDVELRNILVKRWMLSALAGVYEPNGVSTHGVLVLQGAQGGGKTNWFKNLVPRGSGFAQDGVTLDLDNKDSVFQAISVWLIELGEIDSTFKKSEISHLKSFITRQRDVLRRPYRPAESTFARRTAFFGSVNTSTFLHDETGNRRFWAVACREINHTHGLPMQQVWRELYETAYLKGEKWILNQDELVKLNESNRKFESTDPIAELILTNFNWQADKNKWQWRTITDVGRCVARDPNRQQLGTVKATISAQEGVSSRNLHGSTVWFTPPLAGE